MLVLLGIYIVLAWIFASWTRPLVVMSVIPFGLVGAIWGHYLWDTPLSMFSVVGLLGMAGIIINDSIVLVGTVDDYAKTRPLHRAIVDGAADRLRPVLLTTLTTVLGLAPLLYETSSQALFLKPTVITLAYGLGFGMVLVLLVVPALMAAQADIGRAFASLRRGLGSVRRTGAGGAVVLGVTGLMLALFAATVGQVALTGALPAPLAGLVPVGSAAVAALVLFLGGTAGLVLAGFVLGAGALRLRAPGNR